jgi:hypothetical protein
VHRGGKELQYYMNDFKIKQLLCSRDTLKSENIKNPNLKGSNQRFNPLYYDTIEKIHIAEL